MPHPFRIEKTIEIEGATPEEVWEAITVGEQLEGWWIGAPNEVAPRPGGKVRQSYGDAMYLHRLAEYVRFFRGRPVSIVEHFVPGMSDRDAAMSILGGAIGLGDAP